MKIVIIGGHLSPAISIINNLKNDEVFFIGRKHALEGDLALSLEFQVINEMGLPFYELKTARLQRKLSKHTFLSLTRFPFGVSNAVKILKEIKPDVILGFGGYVQIPVILAAKLLRIPVVLHEQTLEAGLSNRLMAKIATKICISFESSREFFPKNKAVLTGIPLKQEILDVKNQKFPKNTLPKIYITGGSLGSHKINDLVYKNLAKLLEKFEIVHQTGDAKQFNDFDKLTALKKDLKEDLAKRYTLTKFVNSKDAAVNFAGSDLVIARAGANTVCELIFLEKPCLLIPIHFSQRNEQLKNARLAKSLGLAEVADENYLDENSFFAEIEKMFTNLKKYKLNGDNIITDDAPQKIIRVLYNVSKKTQF